jgi:hypothetical protein
MARRLAFIITTLAAVALTACANPTSPTSGVCTGGVNQGSGTCN